MGLVVSDIRRVDPAHVGAAAAFGVATLHEAQGRKGPACLLHASDLSAGTHRRRRNHL